MKETYVHMVFRRAFQIFTPANEMVYEFLNVCVVPLLIIWIK
jgi:hypothetical protein